MFKGSSEQKSFDLQVYGAPKRSNVLTLTKEIFKRCFYAAFSLIGWKPLKQSKWCNQITVTANFKNRARKCSLFCLFDCLFVLLLNTVLWIEMAMVFQYFSPAVLIRVYHQPYFRFHLRHLSCLLEFFSR